MAQRRRISKIAITGLHDTFDYNLTFPKGEDTIILIAPNGYGKTALLSLLNDCLTLNLGRAAKNVFERLDIHFEDKSRWSFERKWEEGLNSDEMSASQRRRNSWGEQYRRRITNPYWVDLTQYDKKGERIVEELPDLSTSERSTILRNIERHEPWILHNPDSGSRNRAVRDNYSREALMQYFTLIENDDSIRSMVSKTLPNFVWPSAKKLECLFIETQRILYEDKNRESGHDSPSHREEIVRQSNRLSELLQESYSEYAATSQSLDRSFPSRLIKRAEKNLEVREDNLKSELSKVEDKRKKLTEVGILVEQSDTIAANEAKISPKVFDALQVYVEDSKRKLSTYDEIYPKLQIFTELIAKKLGPKKLTISRDAGASLKNSKGELDLTSLSSGEKHEFIMLFKLIFDTSSESIVLIDEPEISLHVVWQLHFMADLRRIQEQNPFQSIIATHSPQVFQGFRHLLIDLAEQA
tara:strand:+ start:398 stop:1804 length:1407 start_codon:yes stop_codon:yes gene_type:complete